MYHHIYVFINCCFFFAVLCFLTHAIWMIVIMISNYKWESLNGQTRWRTKEKMLKVLCLPWLQTTNKNSLTASWNGMDTNKSQIECYIMTLMWRSFSKAARFFEESPWWLHGDSSKNLAAFEKLVSGSTSSLLCFCNSVFLTLVFVVLCQGWRASCSCKRTLTMKRTTNSMRLCNSQNRYWITAKKNNTKSSDNMVFTTKYFLVLPVLNFDFLFSSWRDLTQQKFNALDPNYPVGAFQD